MFDYGQNDILPYENEPADPNDHSRCTHGPITIANGYQFFCEMPRGCNHQWQKSNKESRKCISNFFGRNKRCTLAIRNPIIWCRSHYQTNAYQNENWRFQKMHLIDEQLIRIESSDPGTLYTVTLKHSEAIRLDNFVRGVTEPARPPRLHLRGTSFEAPLAILQYFENNFLGRNKTKEHCQSILEWTFDEMMAGRMTEIPHIEFLPQFPGIKLQVQDVQRRGLIRADNASQLEGQEEDVDMEDGDNEPEEDAPGDPDFDPEEAETDIEDSALVHHTPRQITFAQPDTFRHARARVNRRQTVDTPVEASRPRNPGSFRDSSRRQTTDAAVGASHTENIESVIEAADRQTPPHMGMDIDDSPSSSANYDRHSNFGPDDVPTGGGFTAANKGKAGPQPIPAKMDVSKKPKKSPRDTPMPLATGSCDTDESTRAASRTIDRAIAELQDVNTPTTINATTALNLAQNILAGPGGQTRAALPNRNLRVPQPPTRAPQPQVINRPMPAVLDNGPPYLNRREMIARGAARRRLGEKGNVQKPFDKTSK
jgi:hypothetical protein